MEIVHERPGDDLRADDARDLRGKTIRVNFEYQKKRDD